MARNLVRRQTALLAALLLGLGLLTAPRAEAAPPDVSGDWDFTLNVTIPGFESSTYCATYVWQDGEALDVAMACPELGDVLGAGAFEGTIDEGGNFSISGILHLIPNTDIYGTLSEDGNSLEGGWNFGVWEGSRSDVSHWGDVDCDDEANSMDALVVLQYEAGLPFSRPACLPFADGDVDGDVDATDAEVILQDEAALLDRLPVGPGQPPPLL